VGGCALEKGGSSGERESEGSDGPFFSNLISGDPVISAELNSADPISDNSISDAPNISGSSGNGLAAGLPPHIVTELAVTCTEAVKKGRAIVGRRNNGRTPSDLDAAVRRPLEAVLRRRLAGMVLPELGGAHARAGDG
jgi:hypothetical protein